MKRIVSLAALLLLSGASTFAQPARRPAANTFASDFQTIPVMGNVPGAGAVFQTYVAILNPTASSFPIEVTLYDTAGTKRKATITMAPGELKTYDNFLDAVFNYVGGGAVTFRSSDSAGGTRNNRFILNVEVRTTGTRFSTSIPALEFAGTSSRSFIAGITVSSETRTNLGCFNQSDSTNRIVATIRDSSGQQSLGTVELNLPPNAWGQAGVSQVVTNGYIQFDPADAAVCYAVVVDNSTADGRFISAAEYKP
ncbi:MAG: hypothetical protein ABI837_15980 [Acidobacteriota bacterium]